MRDFVILFVHVFVTIFRLWRPGGIRSVVAESVLLKHQLLILNRSRKRAPNLHASDRFIAGVCSLFMKPACLIHSAIALKPSTLLSLHHALINRKYRILFSQKHRQTPGPKGPSKEIINTIVETKRRNPTWGRPRIAQQVALVFGISLDKDVFRRVLAIHYKPDPDSSGLSWLTFPGHMKDSLWSLDLFRCESIALRTHWILVVMDQFSRRIIGFGMHAGKVDGVALCRMFNHAISGQSAMPKYLSSDNDQLFLFERWEANLRILDVAEIKTVPYVPLSLPFIERLIGTIHREYLDKTMFWTCLDLENKLLDFLNYYNGHRTHASLEGRKPNQDPSSKLPFADFHSYRWQSYCHGLYQTPIAA
jgi:putative transposase